MINMAPSDMQRLREGRRANDNQRARTPSLRDRDRVAPLCKCWSMLARHSPSLIGAGWVPPRTGESTSARIQSEPGTESVN